MSPCLTAGTRQKKKEKKFALMASLVTAIQAGNLYQKDAISINECPVSSRTNRQTLTRRTNTLSLLKKVKSCLNLNYCPARKINRWETQVPLFQGFILTLSIIWKSLSPSTCPTLHTHSFRISKPLTPVPFNSHYHCFHKSLHITINASLRLTPYTSTL